MPGDSPITRLMTAIMMTLLNARCAIPPNIRLLLIFRYPYLGV
jgi:hypothetical protein